MESTSPFHGAAARRRSQLQRAALAASLTLLLGAAAVRADDRPTEIPYETTGDIPTLSPDYNLTPHEVVLITSNALQPSTVTLEENESLAWISYSPIASVVVFEREVARSMICYSLVNFSIQEDELRSAPINAGEFVSFCKLKPGRYRYRIVRPDAGKQSIDAQSRLDGVVIVKGPKEQR